MKSPVLLALVFALPALAADPRGDHPDAQPSTPQEQLKMFHLPPGFEIQLVAAEPEIQKPINLTFDAAGRLWVTGSEMYPWPAGTDAQGQPIPNFAKAYDDIAGAFGARGKAPAPSDKARDTVRVLSDFDETGHARKITVFADGLNIPSGVQPLPRKPGAKGDSVIVYSIPNIWLLTDTDGDGRADTREVLYGTAGFLDTHGGMSSFLYWIDGWIYGTHGFRNHSEIRDKTGRLTVLDSGNTYRFRPDGSAFEIYTHGQTNPFGLTVDPLGNFYSADSHSKPVYMLLRGAYYEGIGKQHDGLGFAPRITDDDHGSTAIAGLAYYAAEQFPAEYRGDLFNGNVVTQKINRDKLEWHGSTPRAIRQPDFLTCDDPWFRPVQVKLGPDGALYIADFYNPIIGHYEFPLADPRRDHTHGRIWRVVWRGEKSAPVPPMPDLSGLAAAGLVKKLADPNLIVRTLATNELVDRVGKDAVALLKTTTTPANAEELLRMTNFGLNRRLPPRFEWITPELARANALWALERLDGLDKQIITLNYVDPGEPPALDSKTVLPSSFALMSVIKIGAERMSLPADEGLVTWIEDLAEFLKSSTAEQFRVAEKARPWMERLSRPPSSAYVKPLSRFVGAIPNDDTELLHAARMALRDNLLAPGGYTEAAKLTATDAQLADKIADVSLGAKTPEAAEFLLAHLGRTKLQGARSGEFLRHAVLYLSPEKLGAIAGLIENVKDAPLPQRLSVADNLAQAYRQRGLPLPDAITAWTQRTMVDALATTDEALLKRALESVRETKLDAKLDPLAKIAADPKRTGPTRAAALEALANANGSGPILTTALNDPSSLTLRKRAAELLSQTGGNDAAATLLAALPTAPGELATTIAAGLAKNDDTSALLLTAIEQGKAAPALLRNTLVATALEKRAQPLRDRAAALTKDLPAEDARLDKLIADRVAAFRAALPDAAHGAQVFAQQCAVCHRLQNTGANLGPALDGIGARGLHRLCEDILDPNRNVDPIFRQTVIETTDGQTLAGLNARQEGELLTLTDATGKPLSVPKAKVKSQTLSKLSLMPAAFEQTLPTSDFNDLIAYLLGTAAK